MRTLFVATALVFAFGSSSDVEAQNIGDLLRSIQQGGGWVSIPIEAGKGNFSSIAIPTMGIQLSGCVQVWNGHSGRWDITAQDNLGEGRLDVSAAPGEPVPFTYAPGARSQLDVAFRWSEPRDTTLMLWVGLDGPADGDRDSCQPTTG
jgi:hypothetical protein